MHCISPLASAGFSMLAASRDPVAPPAPTIVCISSMNRIILSFFDGRTLCLFRSFEKHARKPGATTRRPAATLLLRLAFLVSGRLDASRTFPTRGRVNRTLHSMPHNHCRPVTPPTCWRAARIPDSPPSVEWILGVMLKNDRPNA